MKIGVVGPGAMGIAFAWKLKKAAYDVVLIDHCPQRSARLNRSGIVLLPDQLEPLPIRVSTAPSLQSQSVSLDVLLFFVKAFDTEQAARQLSSCVAPNGLAISLQNGLGNGDAIAEALPTTTVLVGTTAAGVTRLDEGVCRWAGDGLTQLGPFQADQTNDRCRQVADWLTQAGIDTKPVTDPSPEIWKKLCVNAAINPVTALLQVTNGALADSPLAAELMQRLITEAVGVANGHGIALDPAERWAATQEVCRKTSENRSSMLQDRLAGRPTEIDQINGAVVRYAEQAGMATPANRVLVSLVHAMSEQMGLQRS